MSGEGLTGQTAFSLQLCAADDNEVSCSYAGYLFLPVDWLRREYELDALSLAVIDRATLFVCRIVTEQAQGEAAKRSPTR